MQPWRVQRPVVSQISIHFDEEQVPDLDYSEKLDPDPHLIEKKLDPDPHIEGPCPPSLFR
jgi:hypothetical protein